jgi:hypothetical protein
LWAVLCLAVACSTEHDLERVPPGPSVAPAWDDPTKASTVGQHFLVEFPEGDTTPGEPALLVRSAQDAALTVHQRAARIGWAAEYAQTVQVPPGLTHVELLYEEWLRPQVPWPPPYREADVSSAFVVESDTPVEILAWWHDEDESWAVEPSKDRVITRVLPVEELGTRYVVVTPAATDEPEWSFGVHVVAFENDTTVTAAPLEDPFRLDAGQVARIRLFPADITLERTWLVTADKPVAVFTGGGPRCVEATTRRGFVWEQLLPVTRWGTEYVALPIHGADASELVLVSDAGSSVQLDCGPALALLPGQVLRVPLDVPTRVTSIGPPVQALVEAGAHECSTAESAPALASLIPQVLSRTTSILEPVDPTTDPEFVEEGWVLTTLASVAGSPTLGDASDPPLAPAEVSSVGDVYVEVLEVDQPSSVQEVAGFRGTEYGIVPYGDMVDPRGAGWLQWEPVTYATHLGYDCAGCVPALTNEPACP